MNRTAFFSKVRGPLFDGHLTNNQVSGMSSVLDFWESSEDADLRMLAAMLGNTYHETGRAMWPITENLNYSERRLRQVFAKYFSARDAAAYQRNPEKIANRAYASRMGNGDEASGDGWRFRGRGFIQITGRANYQKFADLLDVDLIGEPDLALRLSTATRILVRGMTEGLFTGKKLSDFFTDRQNGVEVLYC